MDLARKSPDSSTTFRKAVPNFFAGTPATEKMSHEENFRAALESPRLNAVDVAKILVGWMEAAPKPKSIPENMTEKDVIAGLGIAIGTCVEAGLKPELTVVRIKELARYVGYDLP